MFFLQVFSFSFFARRSNSSRVCLERASSHALTVWMSRLATVSVTVKPSPGWAKYLRKALATCAVTPGNRQHNTLKTVGAKACYDARTVYLSWFGLVAVWCLSSSRQHSPTREMTLSARSKCNHFNESSRTRSECGFCTV